MSAVRLSRIRADGHARPFGKSVPGRTLWVASCRRCGRRFFAPSSDRRALKRQAEAAAATHVCRIESRAANLTEGAVTIHNERT